jgi:hypothetical protein
MFHQGDTQLSVSEQTTLHEAARLADTNRMTAAKGRKARITGGVLSV